jgi:hypothetical protein
MSLWSRIANVLRGEGVNRDIEEELQSHLDEAIEQGRDPAEVRRAFGSRIRAREGSRDLKIERFDGGERAAPLTSRADFGRLVVASLGPEDFAGPTSRGAPTTPAWGSGG